MPNLVEGLNDVQILWPTDNKRHGMPMAPSEKRGNYATKRSFREPERNNSLRLLHSKI